MGGGQGFWLQSLVSPLGFMLDLLQKLLWTILLSTFLLQPYRRYCFPKAEGDRTFDKCKDQKGRQGRCIYEVHFSNKAIQSALHKILIQLKVRYVTFYMYYLLCIANG